MRAVTYAAKSSEDVHGSIADQLRDGHALAEQAGHEVIAEHSDEKASAYSGNRGPGLAAAMRDCERIAHEDSEAALIVQHSDRLARGDGKRAKHLVAYALWAIENDVRILSVQDPRTFDPDDVVYAAIEGKRNHDDSARKSQATKDGLRRRVERGQPVGKMTIAYKPQTTIVDGVAVTERVLDPDGWPLVMRMLAMVEQGHTTGEVARTLNAEGIHTREGKHWRALTIGRLVKNPVHIGEGNYPPLPGLEIDRWREIQARLTRDDPVGRQRRNGGRHNKDASYLLRGVAFCFFCGAPMYTRRQAFGRAYVCRGRRLCDGSCYALPVPAKALEGSVIYHLQNFVGDVESWLSGIADGRKVERERHLATAERERAHLCSLQRERQAIGDHYRELLSAGESRKAEFVLDQVERVETEAEAARQAIADAEAQAGEWIEPDTDAALDAYNELVAFVRGRVSAAAAGPDLAAALGDLLAEVRVEYGADHGLRAEFKLRGDAHVYKHASEVPQPIQTSSQTVVNGRVCTEVAIPPLKVPSIEIEITGGLSSARHRR